MDYKYKFDKMVFAARIKQARKNKALTQEVLSSLLNVNVNTIAKCESAKSKLTLSYTNLIELVNVLEIDVNYLFETEYGEEQRSRAAADINSLLLELTEKERTVVSGLARSLIENR